MPEIKLEHITKRWGKFYAVEDLNLVIADNAFVTLLGPSGCGKTTILRMIAGFESPNEGEIYLGGEPINELTPNKRDTAMVFQSYALLPHYNIFDNVAYGLKLRKLPKDQIAEKVHGILGMVGLEGMEDRMTNQLSGGQQQRVALARALVQQQAGITAIYVTHDQSEAMALSDNIIIMKKGVVDQIGDPHTVYYHPVDEFVADFIGESNFLRGSISKKDGESGLATIEGHEVEVASIGHLSEGDKCVLVLRPESAQLAEEGVLPCKVTLSRFMGNYQNYQVMVGDTLVKITDFNPKNHKIFEVGDEAFVKFGKEDVHVL